jgi:hypothetical protein
MAEKKETVMQEKVKDKEELVEIELFYDGDKYKDDVFVQINGKSILIKRGEKVKVPKKYARVIEQSIQQKAAAADTMNRYQRDFIENSKKI